MEINLEIILGIVGCGLMAICLVLLLVLLSRQKKNAESAATGVQNGVYDVLDSVERAQGETQLRQQDLREHLGETLALIGQNMADNLSALRDRQDTMRGEVNTALSRMDASLNRQSQTILAGMSSIQKENNAQLTEIRKTVDEKLTETLNARLQQSFAQVSGELEKVYRGLGEMQSLASNVGDLKKVLTNVKTRGIWGEVQLGAILESILSPGQYGENIEVVPGSRERVEFAVRLPGKDQGNVWLPIDSKFPQENYLRLVEASEAGDKVAIEEARKSLAKDIRQQGKAIAKYIQSPYSTDFAVMFLPVEGLYAEVMRTPELAAAVQESNRVVIAGPSTLAALLNALQMGFRTLAIEQRSGEVWKLLGTIREDFSSFQEVLSQTQLRLNQASESLGNAFRRSARISRDLEGVQGLENGEEQEEHV